MQKFSVCLDSRDHARRDVVATQKPPDFCLDAGPGAVREFSQQAAVEASVESQTLGNRQHNLPVRDRSTDFFGDMQCGQQRAFLVAGGTGTALLAGKGDEHLVVAIWAANPCESLLQIPTFEKGCDTEVDDRSPESVLRLITLVIDLAERVKMLIQQLPQVGCVRIAWLVEW